MLYERRAFHTWNHIMSTIIPHFYTANLHRTIAYYTQVLCFDIVLDQGELSEESCMLQFGESNLIFEEVADVDPHKAATCFYGKLIVFVNDIESVFSRICDFADVRRELDETENGTREFSISDCNGIELVFAEVMPVFECDNSKSTQELHLGSVDS